MQAIYEDDPLLPRVTLVDWPGSNTRERIHALTNQAMTSWTAWLDASQRARTDRDWPSALLAENHAARLAYLEDKPAMARELALSALTLARELGDVAAESPLYTLLALIAWDDGRSKDGHDHILDALAGFNQQGAHYCVALLTRWYGEHLAVLGANPEARHALQDAERRFRELSDFAAAEACVADVRALEQRARE